jgi:hypothetical protein
MRKFLRTSRASPWASPSACVRRARASAERVRPPSACVHRARASAERVRPPRALPSACVHRAGNSLAERVRPPSACVLRARASTESFAERVRLPWEWEWSQRPLTLAATTHACRDHSFSMWLFNEQAKCPLAWLSTVKCHTALYG